jgi:ATP-dependent DNA helicase UvrD/PcrA
VSVVKLNPEQRRAVEHREGPLLIVAGAGTGKTRVIVERIGNLLAAKDGPRPEQILALTFGNKAADEMRERAMERFGTLARRCRFSTFHAFCHELLSERRPQRALDRIDEWIFLRRHLEELNLSHYFKVSDPGRFLADLVDFCSRCHDNLVTPAEYKAYVDRLGPSSLPASPAEAEEIARQREVSRVFIVLDQLQRKQGLVSFGAMISRAVQMLDADPGLTAELQERYRYILVDEFQDTNTAQFELLVRLAGARRNLTVVGDDDQAIYRFRGASFASFQQFAERYPDHLSVVLDRNYRSTKNILTVAGASIASNLRDRYQPDKKLIAEKPAGPPAEIHEFPDELAQAEHTAQAITDAMQRGAAKKYSEFAVLYRAHAHRNLLVAALERRGIPFEILNLSINHLPLTRDLMAALRVIGDPRDSVSLVRVLADARWQLTAEMLRAMCHEAHSGHTSLLEAIENGEAAKEWERRDQFLQFLHRYQPVAKEKKLLRWLPLLITELGLPRSAEEQPAWLTLKRFITQWGREKATSGLLDEWLEYFAYFEEAAGTIALSQDGDGGFGEVSDQADLWQDGSPENALGRVQLMTVHAAKGLEFERVFVLQLVRRAFPADHRKPLIELPPELWKGPLPKGDFHLEEERRLFYVALTRARETLVLSTIVGGRRRPSPFVDELDDLSPQHLIRARPVSLPTPAAAPAERAKQPVDPGGWLAEWAASPIGAPEKELTLSISQIGSYQTCPLQYHFSRHWQVPVPPTPPLLFGNTVHGALKEVMAAVALEGAGPSTETIREILDRNWPTSGFPDKVQENKYRELGLEQLAGAAKRFAERRMVMLHQEKSFELRAGGCRLIGRIDQIHRAGGGVEMVEYKTGRPYTQKDADRSDQITLYEYACRTVLGLEPAALTLYNLTTQEAVITKRSEKDFRGLEKTIREIVAQILSGSYPAQPGYHCRICAFRAICPAQEERSTGQAAVSSFSTIEPR